MSAIIGSAVLYQEFRDVTFSKFVNFAFGIATTFVGVYFLTTPGEAATQEIPLDEETPLLIPVPVPVVTVNEDTIPRPPRLSKRASSSNLGLGINSQGGLLLLATSPPVSPTAGPRGIHNRGARTSSISSVRSERGARSSSAPRQPLPLSEIFQRRPN